MEKELFCRIEFFKDSSDLEKEKEYKSESTENDEKIIERIVKQGGIQTPDGWIVPGDLDLSFMKITLLPKLYIVGGDFVISYNYLQNLINGPIIVGKSYFCHGNKLTSITGCAKIIGGDFYAANNHLVGSNLMDYRPKFLGGYFDCSYQTICKQREE